MENHGTIMRILSLVSLGLLRRATDQSRAPRRRNPRRNPLLRTLAHIVLLGLVSMSSHTALAQDGHERVLPYPAQYRTASRDELQRAANFSKRIERELGRRNARIAIVFRATQPREAMETGQRYDHGALWVHSPIETIEGETVYGYAVYGLQRSALSARRSELVQDWPLDFILPETAGEVGIIIPSAAMQDRMLAILGSDAYPALHQPAWSRISNPGDRRYQNSAEFLLDIVGAAAWSTTDRLRIKVNLTAWFEPATVRYGWFGRLTAGWFDPELRLDDQRRVIRFADYDSLANFMLDFNLADSVFELSNADEELQPID